jgi:hypothetical protein
MSASSAGMMLPWYFSCSSGCGARNKKRDTKKERENEVGERVNAKGNERRGGNREVCRAIRQALARVFSESRPRHTGKEFVSSYRTGASSKKQQISKEKEAG